MRSYLPNENKKKYLIGFQLVINWLICERGQIVKVKELSDSSNLDQIGLFYLDSLSAWYIVTLVYTEN